MGKVIGAVVLSGVVIVGGWWLWERSNNVPQKMTVEKNVMQKSEEIKTQDTMMPKQDAAQLGTVTNQTTERGKGNMMPEKSTEPTDKMMVSKGAYVEYNQNVLEASKDTKRVLFFYASWCPYCKPADAEFRDKMNEIPDGVTIIRTNYNDPDTDQSEKDLAAKYGVTYQHTYVQIDTQGNVVTKWNGGKLEELKKNLK